MFNKKNLLNQNNKKQLGKIIFDISNVILNSAKGSGYTYVRIHDGKTTNYDCVYSLTIQFGSVATTDKYIIDIQESWKNYYVYIGENYGGSPSDTYCSGYFYIDGNFVKNISDTLYEDIFTIDSVYSTYEFKIISATNYSCCVPYYSKILLSDLSYKQAKDITKEDMLYCYNENTNQYCSSNILTISKVTRYELIKVIFTDNTYLEITIDHPVLTDNGWCCYDPINSKYRNEQNIKQLNRLGISQKVLQYDHTYKEISNIEFIKYPDGIEMYTFDIPNPIDTYIAENCVVHNGYC